MKLIYPSKQEAYTTVRWLSQLWKSQIRWGVSTQGPVDLQPHFSCLSHSSYQSMWAFKKTTTNCSHTVLTLWYFRDERWGSIWPFFWFLWAAFPYCQLTLQTQLSSEGLFTIPPRLWLSLDPEAPGLAPSVANNILSRVQVVYLSFLGYLSHWKKCICFFNFSIP